MLSVSWPGPAVGASSSLSFLERLDRWADGALHRWGWKGAVLGAAEAHTQAHKEKEAGPLTTVFSRSPCPAQG